MRVTRLQAVLSIIVVGAFVLVTSLVALSPIAGWGFADDAAESLRGFGALYSGIIGIIVGFYFGKATVPDKPR